MTDNLDTAPIVTKINIEWDNLEYKIMLPAGQTLSWWHCFKTYLQYTLCNKSAISQYISSYSGRADLSVYVVAVLWIQILRWPSLFHTIYIFKINVSLIAITSDVKKKYPKSHTRVKVIVLKYYFGKSESHPYE